MKALRLLFVHDHPFFKQNEKVFSGGSFPKEVWKRYLNCFSSLQVIGRGTKKIENVKGLVESTHDKVTFNLLFEVSGGFDYFKKSKQIKKKLEEAVNNSDVVVIRMPSIIGLYCATLCIKMKKPYITEVVGCAWDANWNYGSLPIKLITPYLFFKTKRVIRKSEASIYVTKEFLQKRYPNPGKLTAYASNVEINDFPKQVLDNHVHLLKDTKKTLQIGLIGNLNVKYKGFDTIMKALQIVKKNSSINFQLNLVGGGSKEYVNSLIKKFQLHEQVNIIGRLQSGEKVFDFLDSLNLYVQPSKTEGLPRAVIEAMGRGCPVLASAIGGIPELLDKKYLHNPGDYKMLAKQLLFFLPNTSELVNMSIQNFKKSKEYSNDILTKRRDTFWGEVTKLVNQNHV
jgi:glycosyltransferase involved in cell wall biosynthesis